MSIKSQYANLIISGAKKIELRRKVGDSIKEGTILYIYSSKDTKKVIGEVVVKKVHHLKLKDLWKSFSIDSAVSWDSFKSYFNNLESGFAIEVYRQKKYLEPLSLKEFSKKINIKEIERAPQSYMRINHEQ